MSIYRNNIITKLPSTSSFLKPINLTRPIFLPHKMSSSTNTKRDYFSLPTPSSCYVDFCLVPIGTATVSVAKEVAEVQKVIRASGIKHTLHSAGTTLEGSWDEVMKVIGQAHSAVHEMGAVRIQTSMRVGSRVDKVQTAEEKVRRVEGILEEEGA
ncbi:YkoF-like protein [Podospora fimiseda]|uniref:YkoF-like protein n=1 Tax=Podospora fimiseda TaxID=252190 RepID=A0AAN7H1D9_9PEZI|nr:YkoF-like protein [Podospora fimiseda]